MEVDNNCQGTIPTKESIVTMPSLTLAIIDQKSDFTCSWEL